MRKAYAKSVAVFGLLIFPGVAHANVNDYMLYVSWIVVFAFVMGLVAVSISATKVWRPCGVFLVSAGICTLVTWIALALSWQHLPILDRLFSTLLFALYVAPIPFLIPYAAASIWRSLTKSNDRNK